VIRALRSLPRSWDLQIVDDTLVAFKPEAFEVGVPATWQAIDRVQSTLVPALHEGIALVAPGGSGPWGAEAAIPGGVTLDRRVWLSDAAKAGLIMMGVMGSVFAVAILAVWLG